MPSTVMFKRKKNKKNSACVRTIETPVEKCVVTVTDFVSGCPGGNDGSLRCISRIWFAGMSENIYANHVTPIFTKHTENNNNYYYF